MANRIMALASGKATSLYHNEVVQLAKPVELIGLYSTADDSYKLSDPVTGFYTVIQKSDTERLASAELAEASDGTQYVVVKVSPMLNASGLKNRKPLL
jgi:hypothetical protein